MRPETDACPIRGLVWLAAWQGVLPNTVQSVSNEAEITEVTVLLPEDEFVVLACDGLWDVLTSQEVSR